MPRYSHRSRSRSRTRSRSHSRTRSRSHSNGNDEPFRLHIADLSDKATTDDLDKAFSKYGLLDDVWMAKNPPCFGFVVFKQKKDAEEALREMDGRSIAGSRVRVTWAKPRTKGRRRGFDPNMRCYQCGGKGHFSRDCDGKRGKPRYNNRRYSR